MPGQAMRKKSVRQKLNAIGVEFKGKNVLLVDDSIVRGTTSREIVQMAREAGARKVYFRLGRAAGALPERLRHRHAEPAGADRHRTQRRRDRREIGADRLIYQDLDALKAAVQQGQPAYHRLRCVLLRRALHHRRYHSRLFEPDRSATQQRQGQRCHQPDGARSGR